MFDYLGINTRIQYGTIKIPGWDLTTDNLFYNINKAENYYHDNPTYNFDNDILKSLLSSFYIPTSIDPNAAYHYIRADGLFSTTTFGITSAISKGRMHKGFFYGQGTNELVMAYTSELNISLLHNNWKTLQPIRVLRHEFDSLSYININGKNNYSDAPSFAVIGIDITKLYMMYYYWQKAEKAKSLLEGGTERNVGHFIAMYVLPNMIESHNDVVIINKYYNRVKGLPDVSNVRHTPQFFTINVKKVLDEQITNHLKRMSTSKWPIVQIGQNTMLTNNKSIIEHMEFASDLINYQNKWLWFLSNFKPMIYLLSVGGSETVINKNKFVINTFIRELDRMINDGSFSISPLVPIKELLVKELAELKKLCKY